ncbi:hypothetical protein EYF80_043457 [Liparis tanakae]|uniref:Uncharacterized protein n=1 Tax=Liparis tanakae TaxID=230148 RepID=A0A4Z2FYL8_9TELE|nr:hypothetical protein EYF80_043457 [Liparis tanakae]
MEEEMIGLVLCLTMAVSSKWKTLHQWANRSCRDSERNNEDTVDCSRAWSENTRQSGRGQVGVRELNSEGLMRGWAAGEKDVRTSVGCRLGLQARAACCSGSSAPSERSRRRNGNIVTRSGDTSAFLARIARWTLTHNCKGLWENKREKEGEGE